MIDSVTVYAATILPILFWHFSDNRNFTWFLKGDFYIPGTVPLLPQLTVILFWLVMSAYVLSEIDVILKTKEINLQKNGIVTGTALSWYIGIIYFNSDLVFTFLNILCHGIPYMTLVWIHGKKSHNKQHASGFLKIIYGRFSLLFFLLPLILLAYVEEGFWDLLVWNEHGSIFFRFKDINPLSKQILNILVPLLALPQLFHYVIDGFIWKIRNDKFEWTKIIGT
jgi:hypothetical protein